MAGVIVFVVGASVAAVAVATWGVVRWRSARGRRW
jgi:hypothetical protein